MALVFMKKVQSKCGEDSLPVCVILRKKLITLLLTQQEYSREACVQTHECGHLCGGLKGEAECLPCLHGCSNSHSLKQDADDMCMICFSEALSAAPAIQVNK